MKFVEVLRGEMLGVPVDFTITQESDNRLVTITVSWLMPHVEWDPLAEVLKVWPPPLGEVG